MRLLRLYEAEKSPGDRVFAYSRIWALVFVFAMLCGSAGAVIFGLKMKSSILYYVAGMLLLVLLLGISVPVKLSLGLSLPLGNFGQRDRQSAATQGFYQGRMLRVEVA